MSTTSPLSVVIVEAPPGRHSVADLALTLGMVPGFNMPNPPSDAACLGTACRAVKVTDTKAVWTGAANGGRWIFASSAISRHEVDIRGTHGVSVGDGGNLHFDGGFDDVVKNQIFTLYSEEREHVPFSAVNEKCSAFLHKMGGQRVKVGVYVFSDVPSCVHQLASELVKMGGVGAVHSVDNASSYAAPIARSVEDEVNEALETANAAIEKAREAQTDDVKLQKGKDEEGLRVTDTAHLQIDAARARLTLWRDRLGLSLAEVEAKLTETTAELDTQTELAIIAIEARKRERSRGGLSSSGFSYGVCSHANHPAPILFI